MVDLRPVDEKYLSELENREADNQATERSRALKNGNGGGTLPPVDVVDAKIDASEARTATKFAELRGDLQRLPGKGTIWGAVGTIVASFIAMLGIVFAVLAFGGGRFDSGMSARGAVDYSMNQQRAVDRQQDDRAAATDKKLDAILARLPTK